MNRLGKTPLESFVGIAIGLVVLVLTNFAWFRFQTARYHRHMVATLAPDDLERKTRRLVSDR